MVAKLKKIDLKEDGGGLGGQRVPEGGHQVGMVETTQGTIDRANSDSSTKALEAPGVGFYVFWYKMVVRVALRWRNIVGKEAPVIQFCSFLNPSTWASSTTDKTIITSVPSQ